MFSFKKLYVTIIDIIYPRRCPICDHIVLPKGKLICDSCKHTLVLVDGPRCMKCSKQVEQEEIEYCYDCRKNMYHYTKGFAVWVYNKHMSKSIAEFKYKGRVEYVDYYVSIIKSMYGDKIKSLAPDILVPVPLHKDKLHERGYNQAEILAEKIGTELNIPVVPKLLIREKYTLPQKELSDVERLKNLEKAFSFSQDVYNNIKIPVHKIMIIDDIYTTGSTIEVCSKLLLKHGIKNVYFLSLSIGKGF